MTGCDLKFMAEEAIYRASRERSDLRVTLGIIADDLAVLPDYTAVAQLAAAVQAVVERLRDVCTKERTACGDCVTAGLDTIEKVREHFHEAVDQRVEEEQQNDDRVSQEDVSERIGEAMQSLKRNLKRAIADCIDDTYDD